MSSCLIIARTAADVGCFASCRATKCKGASTTDISAKYTVVGLRLIGISSSLEQQLGKLMLSLLQSGNEYAFVETSSAIPEFGVPIQQSCHDMQCLLLKFVIEHIEYAGTVLLVFLLDVGLSIQQFNDHFRIGLCTGYHQQALLI